MTDNHRYIYSVVVERVVMDTVTLSVDCDEGPEAARNLAEDVARVYPQAHEEEGVSSCYVENREILASKIISTERVFYVEPY